MASREEEPVTGEALFEPNGFVVALQAAIAAIWHTPVPALEPCRQLHDALVHAVGIGDDTDTVPAIAGSLVGARWGASAMPVASQHGMLASDRESIRTITEGADLRGPDDTLTRSAALYTCAEQ